MISTLKLFPLKISETVFILANSLLPVGFISLIFPAQKEKTLSSLFISTLTIQSPINKRSVNQIHRL